MTLGAHLHATWDILAFVHHGPGPKSKQALTKVIHEGLHLMLTKMLFTKHGPGIMKTKIGTTRHNHVCKSSTAKSSKSQ